jgi:hypothetical protein
MIHPLLSPRLYFRNTARRPLPPQCAAEPSMLRIYARHAVKQTYLRFGPAMGFIAGLAIAAWALLPSTFR